MFKEFKEFALRGNVVDLAVGIIIGAAFGKITSSLVNDILMPPIGLLLGNVDFSSLFISLGAKQYGSLAAAKAAGAATINYGVFITTIIDFILVAFAVFLLVKFLNRLQREAKPDEVPAPPATKACPFCTTQIPIAATRCPACTSNL